MDGGSARCGNCSGDNTIIIIMVVLYSVHVNLAKKPNPFLIWLSHKLTMHPLF